MAAVNVSLGDLAAGGLLLETAVVEISIGARPRRAPAIFLHAPGLHAVPKSQNDHMWWMASDACVVVAGSMREAEQVEPLQISWAEQGSIC